MKPGTPPTTSGGDRRWPNERRVVNVGLAIADRFDEDVVSPVVAEVVDVEEALDTMLDERLQADARAPTDDLDAERPEEGGRRDFEIEQRLAGLLLRRLSFQQIPRIPALGEHPNPAISGQLKTGHFR